MAKVLRIVWDREHKSGFQVLGGFRVHSIHLGGARGKIVGFQIDLVGTRLAACWWSSRLKDWIAYMRTYGVIRDYRASFEPPFNNIRLWLGPLSVTVGPAYGGFLKSED